MLTIGQLAGHIGVTVEAVRHYHRIGLLPEPERDAAGYRRYDARAVIALTRIEVLSDAGVPLREIQHLLAADVSDLASTLKASTPTWPAGAHGGPGARRVGHVVGRRAGAGQ